MSVSFKALVKKFPLINNVLLSLDNANDRRIFVENELSKISPGKKVLDAGCGSQQYRDSASHLEYFSQDFGAYTADTKKKLDTRYEVRTPTGFVTDISKIDYVGNIWDIAAPDSSFDAILCTEVFEHIPYPEQTIAEFARLLCTNGKLILTVPSNCLRHMDPYFFYTGFSDRWVEYCFKKHGFESVEISAVGDYYRWMSVEIWRTIKLSSLITKVVLFPTFAYFYMKKKTPLSVDTLCMGYHIVAVKK